MVDSSVWIDHFNGVVNRPVAFLRTGLATGSEDFVIGDLILLEVLRGFRSDKEYLNAQNALQLLECFDLVGKRFALVAAQNYRILRKQGITIRKDALRYRSAYSMVVRRHCH
jgi:hypothetical protein